MKITLVKLLSGKNGETQKL